MAEVTVQSEIPGKVIALEVNPGDDVAEEDAIVLLESMKMEIPVGSPVAGKVTAIHVDVDDMVEEGDTIATIEA